MVGREFWDQAGTEFGPVQVNLYQGYETSIYARGAFGFDVGILVEDANSNEIFSVNPGQQWMWRFDSYYVFKA